MRLRQILAARPNAAGLVVHMGWVVGNLHGVTGIETWGGLADRLAQDLGMPVISVYDQDLVIEEQMQAALRAHRQFVAPSGVYRNPHWIPAEMLEGAPLDEQLSFLLGRVVPDYAGLLARRRTGQMFARGNHSVLAGTPRARLGSSAQRRAVARPLPWPAAGVDRQRAVDWRIPGGAPKKTRTLFRLPAAKRRKGRPCRPDRRTSVARRRIGGSEAHPPAPHGRHAAQDAGRCRRRSCGWASITA